MADDSRQALSPTEVTNGVLGTWKGVPYVTYIENVPPYRKYRWNGSNLELSNPSLLLPTIVTDITRNSANDATDSTEQIAATFVIPPNVLRIGSIVSVYSLWEHTNSASSKSMRTRLNTTGGAQFQSVAVTTLAISSLICNAHVHDATNMYVFDSASVSGGNTTAFKNPVVAGGIVATGFSIVLTTGWSAPAAGEFIRLKLGKVLITY